MIEVKNLKKSFEQGNKKIQVIDGLELNIKDGESVAIIGKSGSGKSTFLSLIAGLDKVDSGEINISSTDITKLNEKELTKFRSGHIGIVFQNYHLMEHLSALENIKLALDIIKNPNSKELSLKYLDEVGLKDRAHHMPSQLSGGEKQRVAFARAMAITPSLLLADEPSGNLDESTSKEVMDILFERVKDNKMTMLLVTHDNDLTKRCDRVLSLRNGILVQE